MGGTDKYESIAVPCPNPFIGSSE